MVEPFRDVQENGVVVIVDDDPAVCSSLEFSLEIEGYRVETYPNGAELLKRAQMPTRGCLVIDYCLPEMNGLEVAHALRERQVLLPIILITTHPTLKLRQSAAAEGIPIVEKPLLGNSLVEGIRAAFGSKRNAASTQH